MPKNIENRIAVSNLLRKIKTGVYNMLCINELRRYLSIYQAVTGLSINILCFVKKQFRKLPEKNILFNKMRSFTEKQTGNLAFQTEFVLT